MIHHVPLSELPADVQVPDELKNRFWFDAERKRLCFDGFMSKYTYDRLETLSRDRLYQRALEDLFRISVPDDEARQAGRLRSAVIVVLTAGLIGLTVLAAWGLLLLG